MSWAEVKHALNSTLGTDEFYALDKLINIRLSQFNSFQNIIYNEPGSYTYTVPDGIYMLYVSAAAGGGGGGGCNYNSGGYGGGGGGGAAVFNRAIFVEPGERISITVGSGGVGGTYASSGTAKTGADGGNTIFGSYFTLLGGKGGTGASGTKGGNGGAAGGEGGGVGGTYTETSTPQPGITGPVAPTDSGTYYHFGGGGSLGTGGYFGRDIDDTSPLNGGGGSGGNYNTGSDSSLNGQDGANGVVFITAVQITEKQANATSLPSSTGVIKNIQRGTILSYQAGQNNITLSGFSNENSMFVILNCRNTSSSISSSMDLSSGVCVTSLTVNTLTVSVQNDNTTASYQVIEFA